jgi:hypothetical protein
MSRDILPILALDDKTGAETGQSMDHAAGTDTDDDTCFHAARRIGDTVPYMLVK